eukprot:sb/3476594/
MDLENGVALAVEPTETSKQPIRTRYLGHVAGYQPIREQYFLIWSVPDCFYTGFQIHNTLTWMSSTRFFVLACPETSVYLEESEVVPGHTDRVTLFDPRTPIIFLVLGICVVCEGC